MLAFAAFFDKNGGMLKRLLDRINFFMPKNHPADFFLPAAGNRIFTRPATCTEYPASASSPGDNMPGYAMNGAAPARAVMRRKCRIS